MTSFIRSVGALAAALLLVASPGDAAAQAKPIAIRTKHFEMVARDKKIAQAKGKLMELAAERFKKLFGEYAPFGRVKLTGPGMGGNAVTGSWTPPAVKPGEGEPQWTLPWHNPPRGQRPTDPDLMSHEAGHLMFNTWILPKISGPAKTRKDRYGSKMPDWWDEAVAVYLEPEYMLKIRRKQVRGYVNKRKHIPLAELFTSEHPLADELNQPGGAKPADFQRKADLLTKYYGQCYAVLDYLMRMGKTKYVQAICNELAAGKSMDEALKSSSKKKSMKTVKGLERGFLAYVKKYYR